MTIERQISQVSQPEQAQRSPGTRKAEGQGGPTLPTVTNRYGVTRDGDEHTPLDTAPVVLGPGWRRKCQHLPTLDIRILALRGRLRPGSSFSWVWARADEPAGNISAIAEGDHVRLRGDLNRGMSAYSGSGDSL